MTLLAVLCALCPAAAFASPAALGPNLLRNPHFTSGDDYWRLEVIRPASATVDILGRGSAPAEAGGRAAQLRVVALGPERWHAQFYQAGLTLQEGAPYTLSFWARSDRARPLSLNCNVDTGDGHSLGLVADRLPLSREWRPVTLLFTATRTVPGHGRLTFVLGDAAGIVELAAVSLRRGRESRPEGGNILRNGEFQTSTDPWMLETKAPGAATLQASGAAPGGAPGCVARIEIAQVGQEPWHVQLMQDGLNLEHGEPYTLVFWARADRVRPLPLTATLDLPDWHAVGLHCQVTLGPEWRKHVLTFTVLNTIKEHTRLAFLLGDAPGVVELAGISLVRQRLPGGPGPVDSRQAHPMVGAWGTRPPAPAYYFTFNADGTGTVGTMPPSAGAPRARGSSAFRWAVEADGRRVIIGARRYAWRVEETGSDARLILTDSRGRSRTLWRR